MLPRIGRNLKLKPGRNSWISQGENRNQQRHTRQQPPTSPRVVQEEETTGAPSRENDAHTRLNGNHPELIHGLYPSLLPSAVMSCSSARVPGTQKSTDRPSIFNIPTVVITPSDPHSPPIKKVENPQYLQVPDPSYKSRRRSSHSNADRTSTRTLEGSRIVNQDVSSPRTSQKPQHFQAPGRNELYRSHSSNNSLSSLTDYSERSSGATEHPTTPARVVQSLGSVSSPSTNSGPARTPGTDRSTMNEAPIEQMRPTLTTPATASIDMPPAPLCPSPGNTPQSIEVQNPIGPQHNPSSPAVNAPTLETGHSIAEAPVEPIQTLPTTPPTEESEYPPRPLGSETEKLSYSAAHLLDLVCWQLSVTVSSLFDSSCQT